MLDATSSAELVEWFEYLRIVDEQHAEERSLGEL
jgi:hypothetical protein